MRGHGFAVGGALDHRGGAAVGLSAAQCAGADDFDPDGRQPKPLVQGRDRGATSGYEAAFAESWRAWEYWATRAGSAT